MWLNKNLLLKYYLCVAVVNLIWIDKAFDVFCCLVRIYCYKSTHFHICDDIYNLSINIILQVSQNFVGLLVLVTGVCLTDGDCW